MARQPPGEAGEVLQAANLDERLVVQESFIEGRGLLSADAVASATVVIRLGGRLVSSAELDVLSLPQARTRSSA